MTNDYTSEVDKLDLTKHTKNSKKTYGGKSNQKVKNHDKNGAPIFSDDNHKSGGVAVADTTLQLNPPAFQIPSSSAPKGIKRKWSLIDGPVDQQIESSLCLCLGHSSSSSDSKGSAATACTSMSSAKETEEESSMDLELDFTLHLGSEKSLNPRKSASLKFPSAHLKVDLELSLSSGIAESDITTFYPSSTSAKNVLNRAFTDCPPAEVSAGGQSKIKQLLILDCPNTSVGGQDFLAPKDKRS
ncbi:Uncharacterized protein Fot_12976 [Forsythia ovata]|uniref:Uncharacterized protein n=1 Tax=Forsythia ovata TaxID=205694 RepID=A0ABD1W4B6_9LAMI